jgi:DNA (cytosine-5)-methyltransferase 1
MTFGSLFAGIGGFDLGLERAGMRCVWQVEKDGFCRRVLAKHWPEVRRHDDVATFPPGDGADWRADLICGGFPCQDISLAGKGGGIDGPRSRLWFEFARVLRLLRPRYVVVENSPALANRGLSRVLGALAELGLDAEWAVLPASAFGACHIRARMFVVAYPQRGGRDGLHVGQQAGRVAADAGEGRADGPDRAAAAHPPGAGDDADADGRGCEERLQPHGEPPPRLSAPRRRDPDRLHQDVPHPDRPSRAVRGESHLLAKQPAPVGSGWWAAEPDVVRVVHGFPGRVDRVRALGNAVVPQVAEWIGRRITALEAEHAP